MKHPHPLDPTDQVRFYFERSLMIQNMITAIPFVTIGIIARDEEKNISHTLSYLIKQSYPHDAYEIIIVDGNSRDKTRDIADKTLTDSGIHFQIINEANEEKDEK